MRLKNVCNNDNQITFKAQATRRAAPGNGRLYGSPDLESARQWDISECAHWVTEASSTFLNLVL